MNSEPVDTIKQIRNILGEIPNYVLEYLEISDDIKKEWKSEEQRFYLNKYSGIIQSLIQSERQKAKIELLNKIYDMRYITITELGTVYVVKANDIKVELINAKIELTTLKEDKDKGVEEQDNE